MFDQTGIDWGDVGTKVFDLIQFLSVSVVIFVSIFISIAIIRDKRETKLARAKAVLEEQAVRSDDDPWTNNGEIPIPLPISSPRMRTTNFPIQSTIADTAVASASLNYYQFLRGFYECVSQIRKTGGWTYVDTDSRDYNNGFMEAYQVIEDIMQNQGLKTLESQRVEVTGENVEPREEPKRRIKLPKRSSK